VETLDYLVKALSIAAISVASLSWLIFFTIKNLSKYTDFGKRTEQKKEKEEKAFFSKDDIPSVSKEEPAEFFYETPKIETSFGGKRIGEVYEHTPKN
jgi:hypothetical protein